MLEAAKKRRAGTRTWLSRALKGCQDLMTNDMTTESQMSCDLVLDNLQRRPSASGDAQGEEAEDQLADEIIAAADFKATVNAAKVELLTAWAAAHPVTTPIAGVDDAESVSAQTTTDCPCGCLSWKCENIVVTL